MMIVTVVGVVFDHSAAQARAMPYEAEKEGQEDLKESALMVRCGTGRSHMLSSSQEGE